jgi:uncharacterized protein
VLIGLAGGVLSGLFGIGGGVIIVPLLLLIGFSPAQAAGTTLAALVPPVGLLAAIEYYKLGNFQIRDAAILAGGLILGSWASARFAQQIPATLGKQVFGGFLVLVGLRFVFSR